jgi:collagenase-like PrtC family protease
MDLCSTGLLDGIVFSDFYLLNALGRHPRFDGSGLEALPSVNTHIDNPRKLRVCLDAIEHAGFRRPSQIILDRALNRQPNRLKAMADAIGEHYPGMAIGLLANEGCLPHCPFKAAHDAHMALGNMGLTRENTYGLNADLGCLRVFRDRPDRIFQSPFIRPEDVNRYAPTIDYVKIGGRTLGTGFLKNTINAYIHGRYGGNLLALMDTLEALAATLHVAADRIPDDFFTRMTSCPDNCHDCGYCRRLARRAVTRLPLQLPDLRRQA